MRRSIVKDEENLPRKIVLQKALFHHQSKDKVDPIDKELPVDLSDPGDPDFNIFPLYDLQLFFENFVWLEPLWVFRMVDKEQFNLQISTCIGMKGKS